MNAIHVCEKDLENEMNTGVIFPLWKKTFHKLKAGPEGSWFTRAK